MASKQQKARAALAAQRITYVPAQQYATNLLEHLDDMELVAGGVFIDWAPAERRK